MESHIKTVLFILLGLSLIIVVLAICGSREGYSPPPSLRDRVRVYISSPLFNMSDLYYSLGANGLTSTRAGSIASDNVSFSESAEMANLFDSALNIPKGGIVQICAKKGWECYSPARDGFNMAEYVGAASAYLGEILTAGSKEAKALKAVNVTMEDVPMVGAYLLMAVYGFDMYNLINRCNCFIFNSAGITMDDGSVAELGIGSARGLPIVLHAPEDVTLFAGGIVNPMVAGAGSIDLRVQKWKYFTIEDACNALEKKIKKILSGSSSEYWRTTPPPKGLDFWSSLGGKIWKFKFKDHVVDQKGVVVQNKSLQDVFRIYNSNDKGKAYIAGHIIGLVKQTQQEFNVPLLTSD